MNIKEVGMAMQAIEFVLHSLKNQDQIKAKEMEFAHKQADRIVKEYLLPNGAFKKQ